MVSTGGPSKARPEEEGELGNILKEVLALTSEQKVWGSGDSKKSEKAEVFKDQYV